MSDADGPGAGSWPHLQSLARRAEDGGIDGLWLYDHFIFRFPDEDEGGIHEATTLLAAVAAVTQRAELGTIVLGTGFRPPALTAKMAATIDEISGGRLILGLGAGWHEPEYTAFGYPYDHRVGRFEETLEIILPLTRGERVTFHGRFHDVEDAVLLPKPRREGGTTGGPPLSRHEIAKRPGGHAQSIATLPWGTESAPYFSELVASSCSAMPIISAARGVNAQSGPLRSTRASSGPRNPNCSRTSSSTGTSRQSRRTRMSWLTARLPTRSSKRFTRTGSPSMLLRASACTLASMFLER